MEQVVEKLEEINYTVKNTEKQITSITQKFSVIQVDVKSKEGEQEADAQQEFKDEQLMRQLEQFMGCNACRGFDVNRKRIEYDKNKSLRVEEGEDEESQEEEKYNSGGISTMKQ